MSTTNSAGDFPVTWGPPHTTDTTEWNMSQQINTGIDWPQIPAVYFFLDKKCIFTSNRLPYKGEYLQLIPEKGDNIDVVASKVWYCVKFIGTIYNENGIKEYKVVLRHLTKNEEKRLT